MMKSIRNFHGQVEEVPEEILKIVRNAPTIMQLPLVDGETGTKNTNGHIRIQQRRRECRALNSHEPRPFIICWRSLDGCTDISFYLKLGGDHGALHAARRMFERYTEHKL